MTPAPPVTTDDPGIDPAGAEANAAAIAFETVSALALDAEKAEGQHGRRVVKVFSDDPKAPELWHGVFGNAPVEPVEVGRAGYVLSDGEVVTL